MFDAEEREGDYWSKEKPKTSSTMQEIIDLLESMTCFASYEVRLKYQVKILHKLNQLQNEKIEYIRKTNEKLQSLINP